MLEPNITWSMRYKNNTPVNLTPLKKFKRQYELSRYVNRNSFEKTGI